MRYTKTLSKIYENILFSTKSNLAINYKPEKPNRNQREKKNTAPNRRDLFPINLKRKTLIIHPFYTIGGIQPKSA